METSRRRLLQAPVAGKAPTLPPSMLLTNRAPSTAISDPPTSASRPIASSKFRTSFSPSREEYSACRNCLQIESTAISLAQCHSLSGLGCYNPIRLFRHPAIPWVLPFAIFIALLMAQQAMPAQVLVPVWMRLVLPLAAILAFSRPVLRVGPSAPLMSILLGLAVFVIWVGPDAIAPAWRHSFLFDNSIVGHPAGSTPAPAQTDPWFLFLRVAVSVVAVPILEELFWRGWLMRWLANRDFTSIPLGTYEVTAFWLVAILFASEHGSFWDVGLLTGIVFNWWMVRTKNLWDCIIAHAVTNGVLAAYVIVGGHWEYWL